MEEAVTEQIIKSAALKVETNQPGILTQPQYGHGKENAGPGDLVVNQSDMGVVNVQNYVKENQRNQLTSHTLSAGGNERHIEEGDHNESVNTALNPDKITEEAKTATSNQPNVSTPIMSPPDLEISKAASRLTADTGIVFRPLAGRQFHEREILDILKKYNSKLNDSIRLSFAPPELLL